MRVKAMFPEFSGKPNQICGVFFFSFLILTARIQAQTQDKDVLFIRSIYDQVLRSGTSYSWLEHISEKIGGRIAGSPQSEQAISFTHTMLDSIGCDTVWNLPCQVKYWYRGSKRETFSLVSHPDLGNQSFKVLALGGSGASAPKGATGEIIEFKSLDEAKTRNKEIPGKIVYFSRAFDQKHLRTFHAYGGAVDQRVFGPNLASKYGATACVIRSMGSRIDPWPHTGVTIFEDSVKRIPAVALSTQDAEILSKLIQKGPVKAKVKTYCEDRGLKPSFSVIGEIRGSEFPEEIILVGGHLDSWDVGGGAHDDGAGCVQAMEVLHTMIKMNYKPKRTIRCVLFMNEENGLAGGLSYAKWSNENKEFHLAAIESDAGGFTPLGFNFDADSSMVKSYAQALGKWSELLESYDLKISKGGSGADIGPLKSQKGLLVGLSPDSQRYFEYHHTEADRIQAVHPRELSLGTAAMASLIYLIDQYGLQ